MPETPPHLLVEIEDGIMTLVMNRPEARNSLSPEMLVRMAQAWREFRDRADLRVAILTGAGDRDFCAGGDLKLTMPLMTGARQPETEWDHRLLSDGSQFTDAILRGFELYKPVIAAVNGNALGGGTEMTNACDLRVAAEHAVFGTPEAKVGLLPGGGSLTRLPRQIPWARAMEMLLIGDSFSAQQALDMGLLNYVVPRERLMEKARELAGKLAQNGPLAVRKIKEGVLRSSGLPLERAYQIENEVSVAVMTSKDAREGPRAFQEKRKPRFTGE
jgi:enoyl-CoA hydratase